MTKDTIGLDISKDTLDVHRLSTGAAAQFANSPIRRAGRPACAAALDRGQNAGLGGL